MPEPTGIDGGPPRSCDRVLSRLSLTKGNNRGRRCAYRDRKASEGVRRGRGSGVRSEHGRHMKQPRPRANRIALYFRDRGAGDPELIRDGDHRGRSLDECR